MSSFVGGGGAYLGKKPVPEALEMSEIHELGCKYIDTQDRALIYFLYLTGCRISEALESRVRDIQESDTRDFGKVLTVKLITLKNKRHRFRVIPILKNKYEDPMLKFFQFFIEDLKPDAKIFPGSRTSAWNHLAKHTLTVRAVHGRKIVDRFTFKVHPHYMRHCRLTHLVQHYGFDETRLVRFAGWTNSNPAQVYVRLNWSDLAKSMTEQNGW